MAPWAVRAKFDYIFPPDTFLRNISLYINDGLNCDELLRARWKEFEERGNENFLSFSFYTEIVPTFVYRKDK